MSTQGDLERADPGPSFDGQRDEQVREKTQKDAKKTTGEDSALVAAWMHRLQTLTLITTFLTSIDGELFTLTSSSTPQVTLNASEESVELVYACFTGALVFHGCSCEYRDGLGSARHLQLALAILGYVASFALIRYQIVEAETPPVTKTDELGKRSSTHHESIDGKQLLLRAIPPLYAVQSLLQLPTGLRIQSRTSTPPLDLLTRCYFTILALSGAGFILAILGIATYAWFELQRVVGIFTMACLGASLLSCLWAVVY
ncbi:uncharacterized protein BJ212DRAFT_1348100 [Suillus subaureus]|uniref:Uncharacterized protein n=1 Tax=Suillus subaureus TaxID=48587 RepID=A0A9P7JEJ8_9AGAM|nr:uncharacterized protein BJ212DRAFT_1348100 [Suillus subaureus]KAG1817990.1 hypothetical protein BJ212DRAFT_1348100 [Suillus subaureus]